MRQEEEEEEEEEEEKEEAGPPHTALVKVCKLTSGGERKEGHSFPIRT